MSLDFCSLLIPFHKACVKDRIVYHAIYRVLYPVFDSKFNYDSYSCRNGKGTHTAVRRLENFCRKESGNYQWNVSYLKCDIKKFFASIDHGILFDLIKKEINDEDTLSLIWGIIISFSTKGNSKCGLPIGNLTSQLFANVYLNEMDNFIKRVLKVKYYLRYCDDFVLVDEKEAVLQEHLLLINKYLVQKLKLNLHPKKVIFGKLNQGIDFCGYIVLPHYKLLRTKTKKRMFKRVNKKNLFSYLGLIKHCSSRKLRGKINLAKQS